MRLFTDLRARARALRPRLPRLTWILVGLWALFASAIAAQGGRSMLWRFSHDDRHRFTAMAMLTGTLRLRNSLSIVTGDEQIYNGAGYSNWGFGVPMLQLPFQALAHHMKSFSTGFFPDRAIYFLYLAALIPVLWLALNRLLAMREPGDSLLLKRDALSWAGTLFILVGTLYPLMSSRFIVYEETICYLIVFELFALCAYIFLQDSKSFVPVWAMGLAAGIGVIVRPTGLIYMGVWGTLLALERRTKKSLIAYAVATAPFVGFWMYTNWVRSGSLTSFGYENAMPWWPYHTPMQRFGYYPCANSIAHTWDVAGQLFKWFFVSIGDDRNAMVDDRSPFLQTCHFNYELRTPDNHREAFFGLPVLVFLIWTLLHYLCRRERKLDVYVPFAAFAFIFCNFMRGPGFAWRYVGDLWPLIVLIGVQYVRWLPRQARGFLGGRLALVLVVASVACFKKNVTPALPTLDVLDGSGTANLAVDFQRTRTQTDTPLPSHVDCRHVFPWPYHNGQGWRSDCSIDTFSNVFVGVPKKGTKHYELRFLTEGVGEPALRVFVNGRIYTAHKNAKGYASDVSIDYAALHTPEVMITIEWTKAAEPMPGKMLSIELV